MQHSKNNSQNIHHLQFISFRLHFSLFLGSSPLEGEAALATCAQSADRSVQSASFALSDPDWYYLCTRQSRGCFGSCYKTPLITTVEEPSKGLRIKGRTVKTLDKAEDLWSSSTGDMDSTVIPSHISASSISTSNQTLDPHSSSSTASQPPEFINHGLLLWNQIRQQWIGTENTPKEAQVRESRLSWNATYESLLGTSKPFPQPIPLPEMIDFLVEVWEQDGLYD